MKNAEDIFNLLSEIPDPEIPVISIIELGVIRNIEIINDSTISLKITPTYSGCPAMKQIEDDVRKKLSENGFTTIDIKTIFSPPWTTDWITPEAKEKLRKYGIAPPENSTEDKSWLTGKDKNIACPRCKSLNTKLISQFGSTACKALYQCQDCLEHFDYIKLNRPDKFNSFNREMAFELHNALDNAENNENIRAIVLTGTGKAFCAGQDLAEAIDPNGPGIAKIVDEHYNPIILRLRSIEKPIIAAVNGVAAGAGANIALACDIVTATFSASFIQAFSKIGLIPDSGGTFFLPRLIGFQKASALMMLGDKVAATEAHQMGMIYKVFSDETFMDDVLKLAETLSNMPTKAIGFTKRLLNQSLTNDLNAQLRHEGNLQVEAANTSDYKEGVNAFLEKRKPEFKGL